MELLVMEILDSLELPIAWKVAKAAMTLSRASPPGLSNIVARNAEDLIVTIPVSSISSKICAWFALLSLYLLCPLYGWRRSIRFNMDARPTSRSRGLPDDPPVSNVGFAYTVQMNRIDCNTFSEFGGLVGLLIPTFRTNDHLSAISEFHDCSYVILWPVRAGYLTAMPASS